MNWKAKKTAQISANQMKVVNAARAVDVLLAKYTLLALPVVVLIMVLTLSWPWLTLIIGGGYLVALSSCLYRLTAIFRARNPISNFIHRQQGQLRVCSLAGVYDLHGPWQSIPLHNIRHIRVYDHRMCIVTSNSECELSLVATRDALLAYMRAIMADTQVDIT